MNRSELNTRPSRIDFLGSAKRIRAFLFTIHDLHYIMFCPSCGAEYTIELNYCNRCGANLSAPVLAQTGAVSVSLTKPILIIGATLLFLTLGGFAGLISGAIELTRSVGGGDLSMAIIFFGMLTVLTVDIFLVRQLSKLITAALSANRLLPAKRPPAPIQKEPLFPRPATARLEPAPSVTENTTRFFEGSYSTPTKIEAHQAEDELKN